ncbi:MAG: DnaB-like helicase C-terminal domain-containing protein [Pseudomonadota bacterium]
MDASLRRSAIRAGQEMEATLYDQNSDDDAVTTVSKAIESLAGIARNGTGKAAFEDAGEALLSMLTRGRAPSVPTGLKALDRMSRMDRGALTVLAGLTSMGKSALAVEIARRVAAQGLRVRYFSLEMHSEQIGARWVSAQMVERGGRLFPPAGIPYNKIARHDELPLEAVDMIKAEGRNLPSVEIDPTQGLTVSEIIARACDGETPDLVVVDYLNKVRKGDMGDLRHDLQVEAICNRLRDFAKDANCAVLLLSQLNRKKTDGETLVPTMDDLKDSSGIEQAADTVWFVHRPAYHLEREAHRLDAAGESLDPEKREALNSLKPQMTVVVAKQRQGQIGPVQLVANMAHNFVTDTDWGHR